MEGEIINRVEKSGLITIDLDELKVSKNIFEVDIKKWLFEGLFLKEKEYRKEIQNHNWSQYENSYVYIHCSSDAIIPTWAFMLISAQLENHTEKIVVGNIKKLYERIYEDSINLIDFSIYNDSSVVIKGCSDKNIPLSAYHLVTTKLKPFAKSIMYGEACSSVPVFKKSK